MFIQDNLKYILYARRSQDREDRQTASISDQVTEMRRRATNRKIKIVDVIEESQSAAKPGRPGFNSLLQRIYEGEANGILTWKLNRLARNPIDAGQVSWMLQQGVIKHIYASDGEFRPEDNVLPMQFQFGMANQYSRNLSSDSRRGMRMKAERGWYPAGKLPIGYIHNPNYKRTNGPEIIPDPERFTQLRSLWQKMLTGNYTVLAIKEEAQKMGLINDKGSQYALSTFWRFFSQEFYYGFFEWVGENGSRIRHKGRHKKMVTREEFDQVQILLGKRGKPTHKKNYFFPFRQKIKCGACGCSITTDWKHQCKCTNCRYKYSLKSTSSCPKCSKDISEMKNPTIVNRVYYRCTKKRGKCSERSLEQETLKIQIANLMESVSLPEVFHKVMVKAARFYHRDEINSQEKDEKRLANRKKELVKRSDNLAIMRADMRISDEKFRKLQREIDDDLFQIEDSIKGLNKRITTWIDTMDSDLKTFNQRIIEEFLKSDPQKQHGILSELLSDFGSNLILTDQKLIFYLPKRILVLRELYERVKAQILTLEPDFLVEDKSENSCLPVPLFILRADVDKVRTCYIQGKLNGYKRFTEL